jgi:hypothetical protein
MSGRRIYIIARAEFVILRIADKSENIFSLWRLGVIIPDFGIRHLKMAQTLSE